MKQLLFVFIGGGFGSVLRYLISKTFNNLESGFPLGTFIVNVLGSLVIGLVLGLSAKNQMISQNQSLLLATGFCGGFTTFSTFAYENQTFLKSGDYVSFLTYAIASFSLGIIAVVLGLFITKYI